MRIVDANTLDLMGRMLLLYGKTGVGKTISILVTAPKPVLWVAMERKDVPRNRRLAIDLANEDEKYDDIDEKDIIVAYWDDYDATMEFICNDDSIKSYRTIFVDSLTHLMQIDLMTEIENQSIEGMKMDKELRKKIDVKPLAYLSKGGKENYGTLNSTTIRFMNRLSFLHEQGKCVIFSALLDPQPSWEPEFSAAPALTGKAFSSSIPIFFGTIGMVVDKIKDGKKVYPPAVRLQSDGTFMARFTGHPDSKTVVPLNIQKILEL